MENQGIRLIIQYTGDLPMEGIIMPITVNGALISDEAIAETAQEFADYPNPSEAAARSLAIHTLLAQRAAVLGIEADDENTALETLLDREIVPQEVSEAEVQRYFEGHAEKFRSGDLFEVCHILFDTQGPEKTERVRKAEAALLLLKEQPERFEETAKSSSLCSSGKQGGQLGQISQGAVVPEFWNALVAHAKPGLLPHLVESRFGHHIVRIERCAMGQPLPFEAVQGKIRDYLETRIAKMAYQQYIATLIEHADITGISFSPAAPTGPGLAMDQMTA